MRLVFLSIWLACATAAILGVDYGQQFTKAVLLAPGISFEIVLTDEGKRKDLSGMSIRPSGEDIERVFGSRMGSLCTRFPQSCAVGIKSLLGKAIHDPVVSEFLSVHPGVKLIGDDSRNGAIRFDFGLTNSSYQFSVEELFAMNMNEVKSRALSDLDEAHMAQSIVEDVAVSVSPFASPSTRQAYLDGLRLANFSNVLGLVDEGTAVALNYVSNRKFSPQEYNDKPEYHLVYDMGSGSTTATLFTVTPLTNGTIILELIDAGYDDTFGGELLTKSVYSMISSRFMAAFDLDDAEELPPKVKARLLEASEKAKIVLTVNTEYQVSIESLYNDKDFKTTITRDNFEEINGDLMERITKPILDTLKNSKVSAGDVQSVILNGGSTRVPFIQHHLSVLLGEDKLSKKVNADESCALGTTHRGLKLKTQLEKARDVKVIERSYRSHEIEIDNTKEEVIFERGSVVGQTVKKSLGPVENDKVTISLKEDDFLFKSYEVDGLLKKAERLSCRSKETKELVAYFSLDTNKMFELSGLNFKCVPKKSSGGLFNKLMKGSDDSEEEVEQAEPIVDEAEDSSNSTASNSTKSEISKTKSRPVSVSLPKPSYPHIKPLSKTTKERVANKLKYLNTRDEEKLHLTKVRNVLESSCYELRSYIDEHEETLIKELSEDKVANTRQYVADTIEWLDFESDDASLEDVQAKTTELEGKKSELSEALEIASTDLSYEGIKKLYESSKDIMMKIQHYMLEFGTEISEIRKKYEEAGFDFDKENDRIKMKNLAQGDDRMLTFDKVLTEYKEGVTNIGRLADMEADEFGKIAKRAVWEDYNNVAKGIVNMMNDVLLLENSHRDRVDTLNSKLAKLVLRKKQKEEREKKKQLEKEKKTEEDEENNDGAEFIEEDEPVISSATSSTPAGTSTSTATSETTSVSLEHDEL
ncbi:Heat shock protein 70 [Meyerozyma sp. JA9]|nr:Heat shock protein 70 [Meyerozyma sp. JA9]